MTTSRIIYYWLAKASLFGFSLATTDRETSIDRAVSVIKVLQTFYDESAGLWETTGWWNSGNCLTVLGDFLYLAVDSADDLGLEDVFSKTFTRAQQTTQTATKTTMKGSSRRLFESRYIPSPVIGDSGLASRGYNGFINNYYDDEGWWALAWVRVFDVTGNPEYLRVAENIFADMQGGVNDTCGGGIFWSKDRKYKNAIANELYLSVAASLANRAADKDSYLSVAKDEWDWFKGSGMINQQNLINDGLEINSNGSCFNNGDTVWSYNQGVILGGLVELSRATGDSGYLSEATSIAEAAIDALSEDGILHESCEPNDCGADGSQFKGKQIRPGYILKYTLSSPWMVLRAHVTRAQVLTWRRLPGIFIRNLQYLQLEAPKGKFKNFILHNSDSIWNNDRNSSNYLGLVWSGPPSAGGYPNASTHSSALDALVAAVAVL
ncbi:glycosyl hydrolase [Diaporthe helianthi]|uniref:Glycosyl hydrolase n=1 Tax=Diaporthe helianthi TaxID=158607 RepID=A0A2P5HZW4_DIAHE|nr:glycosyl hydrolase [Diaporthe helianthi]